MAHHGLPRMSLVAQYDDLCRYNKILTSGPEEEFKVFVENQLSCVRKWKEADSEVKMLRGRIGNLEAENGRLETKIKHLKDLLQDADTTRRKIEWDKNCLAATIAAVKEVILADGVMDNQTREKLAFLNSSVKPNANATSRLQTIEESAGSLLSLSDIDQTDEDLENLRRSSNRRSRRSRNKRSSSETRNSPKKKKSDTAEDFLNKVNIDAGVRSSSEPTSSSPEIPVIPRQVHKSDLAQFRFNTYDHAYDPYSLAGNTPVSHHTSVKQITKNHQFVLKTNLKSIKCLACRQSISYLKQFLKCQVCGVPCHPECIKQCPALCFPILNTPTKGSAGKVADYTSEAAPMIPPLIVHCVREIESRGLKEIGLYRTSAADSQVKNLIAKFASRFKIIPNLSGFDIHALCVSIKEFLRSLEEPLITRKAWRAFVDAANLSEVPGNSYALLGLVKNLPQPNRDTLSFLILHWQKVAESPYCKMGVENLAKVLGPTVVGYSSAELSNTTVLTETTYQYQVMKLLLSISADSWQNILSVESDVFQGCPKGTPENLPALKETRLGPIYASVQKRKSLTLRKNPLTPRNSKSSNKPGRMHFASPLLK